MQQNKDIQKVYTVGSDEDKNANDIFQTLSKMKIRRIGQFFNLEMYLTEEVLVSTSSNKEITKTDRKAIERSPYSAGARYFEIIVLTKMLNR